MGSIVETDVAIDYASFQILPTQNRYEAFVCYDDKVDKLAEGPLEFLLTHVPEVKALYARGSNSIFKLQLPEHLIGASWFTKLTLNRFLCIVHSSELMRTINATKNEMSQLEEARKFHLSIYTQSNSDHLEGNARESYSLADKALTSQPKVETACSDASKNELLRAMELRLAALETELVTAFKQVLGGTFSNKEIADLTEFSQYVGATDLKDLLCKVLEMIAKSGAPGPVNDDKSSFTCDSSNVTINNTKWNLQSLEAPHSVTPVKYDASPAKTAQLERQSSTESEESSDSSNEGQTSVERSRTLVRSATPRRSASPMRRIQIGRTGSRRPTAVTIKSLSYIPAREKVPSHRYEASSSSETEGSGSINQPRIDVRRMSVQDAISLFENKQKEQTSDIQKGNSLMQLSVGTNKTVLRRWSAGMGEQSRSQPGIDSSASVSLDQDVIVDKDKAKGTVEEKLDSNSTLVGHHVGDSAEADAILQNTPDKIKNQADTNVSQGDELSEGPADPAEWSRQKEAELNKMFMKMVESKPVEYGKPTNSRNKGAPPEQRGGFYDHYKEKRDEKLRESAGKRVLKTEQFKAMQKTLDEKKAKIACAKLGDIGRKQNLSKSQKSHNNPSLLSHSRKEAPKPSGVKKVSTKASSLPATRKSWPSVPSPRTSGVSPSKTPGGISSVGTIKRRSTQPAVSHSRSSAKVEKSPQKRGNPKEAHTSVDKSSRGMTENRQQTVTRNGKTTKTKTNMGLTSGDSSVVVPTKPKVTKRSSVVPLESKPFLRKGSKVGTGGTPVTAKTKNSKQSKESQKSCSNVIEAQEKGIVKVSKPVNPQEVEDVSLGKCDAAIEPESQVKSNVTCVETENCDQLVDNGGGFRSMDDSSSRIQAEEGSVITSSAWVETEEHQDIHSPQVESTSLVASSATVAPVQVSSPCVRQSLSQMLQEDSEPDTNDWGTAENPPSMVYQKDAPKGLKRLLKFARKSKGDSNTSGWSSPSVFSEGEDDTEDSKAVSKRNSENLVRKAAVNAKNWDAHAAASGDSNISNFEAHGSLDKHQEGYFSTTSTSKAARSFFSLSAFRGSKPNETKLR